MTAPDLSAAEAEIVARFDAAPTPPEVLREQVARVMWEAVRDDTPWPLLTNASQERWRRAADAALAVFRGQQDPAVQRVLALADMVERDALESVEPDDPESADHVRACALLVVSHSIRAAIGGDGR